MLLTGHDECPIPCTACGQASRWEEDAEHGGYVCYCGKAPPTFSEMRRRVGFVEYSAVKRKDNCHVAIAG